MRLAFRRALVSIATLSLLSGGIAHADDLRLHVIAGGTLPVGDPQASELGIGVGAALAVELPVGKVFGVQAEVGGLVLSKGDPPANPLFAPRSTGSDIFGTLGVRYRPLGAERVAGPWIDANVGYAHTGDLDRPTFDTHLGWDFRVGTGRLDVGPFLGYTQIFQPGDALRPEDVHVLWLGVHVALGATEDKFNMADRDHDGVFDYEDACPEIPGVRTRNPNTNGCPPSDRDHDTVLDDEDACPNDPGIRTGDPKTNGCPPSDRDHDTVLDDVDACPDVPGVPSSDPRANGCPDADRDNDTVMDKEDACPDVPGIRTTDAKTNGCPASQGPVHVEGAKIVLDEIILFEHNSPQVRQTNLVKKVAEFINKNPDVLQIDIEGHADEVGSDDYNLQLSRERAASVKTLLVQFGVDGSRIQTHAYGESRPRVAGSAEEQYKMNRRVEFTIVKARPMQTPPASSPNGGKP